MWMLMAVHTSWWAVLEFDVGFWMLAMWMYRQMLAAIQRNTFSLFGLRIGCKNHRWGVVVSLHNKRGKNYHRLPFKMSKQKHKWETTTLYQSNNNSLAFWNECLYTLMCIISFWWNRWQLLSPRLTGLLLSFSLVWQMCGSQPVGGWAPLIWSYRATIELISVGLKPRPCW